ncbi:hypothetical protein HN903_00295 [archaeon]|jgi:hypothetical protein|nr:hypothetical protein [archaeon]MBT7128177.1 hypothetical protein [archaeon]
MRSRFLLFCVLIGFAVFVMAAAPDWINGASNVNYSILEEQSYYHNFSANITGFSGDVNFSIDTATDISWTNGSGTYAVSASDVSGWISMVDADSGNFSINAPYDNQTGFFAIPIQATNTTDSEFIGEVFEFIINATNDIPSFVNLNLTYNFSEGQQGNYTVNAIDEEEHYPLTFNLTFYNCTHAAWSGRAEGENCSIFNLTEDSSTSAGFGFLADHNDVGTYFANFSTSDLDGACPHAYCNSSSYDGNKSSAVYELTFNVYSSLSVNITNCTGATVMEGEQFNCTINISTQGEEDELTFSSFGFFKNSPLSDYDDRDWFRSNSTDNASSFFYSLPISITPDKSEVGNWTINFTAWDVLRSESDMEQVDIFVNFTESSVSLNSITDVTIYENGSLQVNASDDDLLVWDDSVKDENLTFVSNSSWVSVVANPVASDGVGYLISNVSIDYSFILANSSEGNYSVMINVSDDAGSVASRIFVVEIINDSAPVWNDSAYVFTSAEGDDVYLNLSEYVSDAENDSLNFSYTNSSIFNSFNLTIEGIINFSSSDIDVGEHLVNITVTDGKISSEVVFNFSISNVADAPSFYLLTGDNETGQSTITEGFTFIIAEGVAINFSLEINDNDFLIPDGQKDYYNESLIVNVSFTNSTGGSVDLFNFSFDEPSPIEDYRMIYNATYTATISELNNYTVVVNITDASGLSINRTWLLNMTETLQAPVLEQIDNVSLTIHDYLNFSLNASDNEDDYAGLNLSYSIANLSSNAPNLTDIYGDVEFNMSSNSSYAGAWEYNVTVNDSNGMIDSQVFWVFVYGEASLVSPAEDSSFNLTENVSSVLNFTINHSVGDNLTYEFWVDNISCAYQDGSNCSYGNFSFREVTSSFGNGSALNWTFIPNFTDESYGNLKNLTMSVYPNSSLLNLSQRESVAVNFSFKLNVSHTNAPLRVVNSSVFVQSDYNTNINLDLSNYFIDEDVSDSYYLQSLNFSKYSGHADISVSHSSGWNISIGTIVDVAFSGNVSILGNDSLSSDILEEIDVTFVAPTVVTITTPSSGGSSGSSTKLKFYSLRIIVPDDVIISDDNYIEIPFRLENSGGVDLVGIDLSSSVLYNNEFTEDVRAELEVTYISELKIGEGKNYSMKILADTHRAGKYKATIVANISSPEFSDWADFFIDLKKTNESDAQEMLIFTESIIANNPECLELTEIFRRAEDALVLGNVDEAMRLASEVSQACEDAIASNEQIRYKLESFVEKNFYYISFAMLVIFFIGFIFYVYKRVKFNKYTGDEY